MIKVGRWFTVLWAVNIVKIGCNLAKIDKKIDKYASKNGKNGSKNNGICCFI